jgi:Heterokaryon incompatibility protein (HET)
MRLFRFRALKWPFRTDKVEHVSSLEHCGEQTISSDLQVDQKSVIHFVLINRTDIARQSNCPLCNTPPGWPRDYLARFSFDFTDALDKLLVKSCSRCRLLVRGFIECMPHELSHSSGRIEHEYPGVYLWRYENAAGSIVGRGRVELFFKSHDPFQLPDNLLSLWTRSCHMGRNPDENPKDPLWWGICTGREPSGDTASEKSFRFLSQALDTCLEGHVLCGNGEPKQLPTRVIDVRPDRLQSVDYVKLCTTSTTDQGMYTCLSHCWGGAPAFVTTTQNIMMHQQAIDISSLPKTCQDAVDITRRLGLKYLWIDMICIIQDDHDDWVRESMKMAEFYSNAYVTIAATKSANHGGGCYSKLRQEYSAHHVGTISTKANQPLHVYARRQLPHHSDNDHLLGIKGLTQTKEVPLLTRAWAFQERLLSPRVIHFANDEISWECRELSDCECKSIRKRQKTSSFGEDYESPKPNCGAKLFKVTPLFTSVSTRTDFRQSRALLSNCINDLNATILPGFGKIIFHLICSGRVRGKPIGRLQSECLGHRGLGLASEVQLIGLIRSPNKNICE